MEDHLSPEFNRDPVSKTENNSLGMVDGLTECSLLSLSLQSAGQLRTGHRPGTVLGTRDTEVEEMDPALGDLTMHSWQCKPESF